jgi:hypothetical protein
MLIWLVVLPTIMGLYILVNNGNKIATGLEPPNLTYPKMPRCGIKNN